MIRFAFFNWLRLKLVASCVVTIFTIAWPAAVQGASIDIEFNSIPVNTTFPGTSLPRTISTDGVDISLSKFNNSSGANGRIYDKPLFGVSNNAFFLAANLRADILLPGPSSGGFFYFQNQGGTNLLEINGQQLNFTNSALASSGSSLLGGVSINSAALNNGLRSVKLNGSIQSLAFVGQELTVDSIKLTIVPEPRAVILGMIALTSFSGFTFTRCRHSIVLRQ